MRQHDFFNLVTAASLTAFGVVLPAQAPVAPTAYTVTVQIQITGLAVRKTYRLGSKVLVDQSVSPGKTDDPATGSRTRTLYDLETKESLSWNPADPAQPCARSSFLVDGWLDPFAGGPDLAMKDVKRVGTETVHGIATTILEREDHPDSYFRLWVDPQTGLMLKAQFISKKLGTTTTYFEVMDVSMTPPPV